MKVPEQEIEDLRIARVFYHPTGSTYMTLYAEFEEERDVKRIRRFVHNLVGKERTDPKVVQFVPKLLQERYSAIQKLAYTARKESNPRMSTKIWITDQIELRLWKVGDNTDWNKIQPEDLTDLPKQIPRFSSRFPQTRQPIHPPNPAQYPPPAAVQAQSLPIIKPPITFPCQPSHSIMQILGTKLVERRVARTADIEPTYYTNIPTSNSFSIIADQMQEQ